MNEPKQVWAYGRVAIDAIPPAEFYVLKKKNGKFLGVAWRDTMQGGPFDVLSPKGILQECAGTLEYSAKYLLELMDD